MAYPRYLNTGNSAADATSYASGSTTPTNGRVLTAWVASVIAAGTPNTPTATGTNGLSGTWTAIANSTRDQVKITLFRSVAASGVAGVLTFDFGGQTNSGFAYGIEEWVDVATTLNVQSTTTTADAATSITMSPALASFASTTNGTYAVVASPGSFLAVRGVNTQGTMMQLATTVSSGTEITGGAFYSPGAITAPQLSVSGAGSDIVAIAMEVSNTITAGSGGGSDTFIPTFRV